MKRLLLRILRAFTPTYRLPEGVWERFQAERASGVGGPEHA